MQLLLVVPILAQQFSEVKRMKVNGSQFCLDNLNNIYVYNERSIYKYNSSGKQLFNYSSTNASNITSIDVLNPLRILVFFKDINQVQFLDNTLSETGIVLNLGDIDLQQASLVCNSASKGIWVFNPQNIELLHLNNDLTSISKTGNLSVLLAKNINPIRLYEFNNHLYLCNQNSIIVFDIFGTYEKNIPINCDNCFITDTGISNAMNDTIYSYNFEQKLITKIPFIGTKNPTVFNGKSALQIQQNMEFIWFEKK